MSSNTNQVFMNRNLSAERRLFARTLFSLIPGALIPGALIPGALILGALLPGLGFAADSPTEPNWLVYVGTYTRGDSEGIYVFRMEGTQGTLTAIGIGRGVKNPSFLAIHPNRRYLYSVSEVGRVGNKSTGGVTAFSIDSESGQLQRLNEQLSMGTGPCHVTVDSRGKCVLVANYGGGSVAVLPIQADGSLGAASCSIQHEGSSVNPRRQKGPHAHSINLDAANRFAFAADLGLDKILVYRFDATAGTLAANDPPFFKAEPGAGPRHFDFHPNGRFAYVINELQSTVTAMCYEPTSGTLTAFQSVTTLPEGFDGNNTTADIHVHPSGKFLYGSNRGHDSIALFSIDPETGRLTPRGQESTRGKTPRNFAIDPTGRFLLAANQDTSNIVLFRVDPTTGQLSATGEVIEVPTPVCIRMMPAP